MLEIHADSHLDHGIPKPIVDHLLERFADREGSFIETVELPPELGAVPCSLYGPVMGDVVDELEAIISAIKHRGY